MAHRVLVSCGVLAGLAFCTQVCAAEGKYDMISCYSGPSHVIQQGDGITAGSFDLNAMMPGQEGTPYYKMSGRCLGQYSIINGEVSANGSCQFWNADGDKIFGVFARKGDPAKAEGTWHVVQGTGKLEGITSEGKWMPVGLPPVANMGNQCNHDWGTYSAK
jgi:hypothetical protein